MFLLAFIYFTNNEYKLTITLVYVVLEKKKKKKPIFLEKIKLQLLDDQMAPSNYLERQQLVYDCMLFPKTWKNENLHIYSFWLFCMDADLLLSKPTH